MLAYQRFSLSAVDLSYLRRQVSTVATGEDGFPPALRHAVSLKSFFDFMADDLYEPKRVNLVDMKRHAGKQAQ